MCDALVCGYGWVFLVAAAGLNWLRRGRAQRAALDRAGPHKVVAIPHH